MLLLAIACCLLYMLLLAIIWPPKSHEYHMRMTTNTQPSYHLSAFLAQFPCKPWLGSCPAILAFCVVFIIWCCYGQNLMISGAASNTLYSTMKLPFYLQLRLSVVSMVLNKVSCMVPFHQILTRVTPNVAILATSLLLTMLLLTVLLLAIIWPSLSLIHDD
jgi:hypothetical protein